MRTLLYAALGVLLLSPGCDLLNSDSDSARPQLVTLSFNALPANLEGEAVWEIQDPVGRVYASASDLPASIPASSTLLLVVADETTCTPKCTPLRITQLSAPSDESERSVTVRDNSLEAVLEFEW